jgi:hypothetical protein
MSIRYIILLLITFSVSLFGDVPHLILNFDINKTLIASDKMTNKSVPEVLNELLAKKYVAKWDKSLDKPISFEDYVDNVLFPASLENVLSGLLRRYSKQHFIDYLRHNSHPLYLDVLKDYQTAEAALQDPDRKVFASFYHLVDALDKRGISYSIVLRSFGAEVDDVKNEINQNVKELFLHTGKFHQTQLFLDNGTSFDNPTAIYQELRHLGHLAIQDDWNHWSTHDCASAYSKPFYVDRQDSNTLSLFFDDNISMKSTDKNIIGPIDPVTGEHYPVDAFITTGQAIPVDTLRAILDPDYFLNCVDAAIEKKDKER